jgi:hypothetical protein
MLSNVNQNKQCLLKGSILQFLSKGSSSLLIFPLLAATFYAPNFQGNEAFLSLQSLRSASFQLQMPVVHASPDVLPVSEDAPDQDAVPPAQALVEVVPQNFWTPTLIKISQAIPVTEGTQVVINGRTLNAAWSQRQQRIGLADTGLMQTVGVELLSTESAARQPVQWFSDSGTNALALGTWLTSRYRYLDITELAQQANWQMQVSGNVLRIATPASRVMAVRQGRQSWGDRIVVDLDRSTPWQVTEQSGELVVNINAQADPALIRNFQAGPGNRLTSINVQASGNQTVIRVGIPAGLRPRVWSLPNPNRLIIDIGADPTVQRNIVWAPGIRWQEQVVNTGSAQFPVIALVVDPRQSGLAVRPIWTNPSSAIGTAPLTTMAQSWQAIAAINGGFFNRNNQLPLGAIRRDNRWISGPILNRGAIAWNEAGEVAIGRLGLQEAVSTPAGQRFAVLSLNSGYVQAGVARYTNDWGSTYTSIIDNEILVTVQDNRVVSQQSAGAAGQTSIPIPANGYVLVVRAYSAAANALSPGTSVQLETTSNPADFGRYTQILGAGPLLLQNRQVVLNAQSEQFNEAFARQAAARSAIGKTAEGNLIMITVQNRIGGVGPTLAETAQIMQRLGAVDALNLDGGSSTTLYLGGQLLNRAPNTAARIHNGIGVFIQPSL